MRKGKSSQNHTRMSTKREEVRTMKAADTEVETDSTGRDKVVISSSIRGAK